MPDPSSNTSTLPGSGAMVLDQRTLMATVREMRKREMPIEMAESMSLGGGFNPMSGITPETMRQQWGIGLMGMPAQQGVYLRCRELYTTNDFVGAYVDNRVDLCNDGFRINGIDPNEPFAADQQEEKDDPEKTAMRQWIADSGYDFHKLSRDIFLELNLNNNSVLFWNVIDEGKLPKVTVLNCEDVVLRNAWGREWIVVTMKPVQMTQEERERLGPRYADAMAGKPLTVINGEQDEYFRYVTGAKNGTGLRMASLYQIFMDLGIRDNLKMGDWNGAWQMRTIIRHIKRGHEIKQGPLAGQDIHFLKDKAAKKIKKGLSQNVGVFDMVTNFDVSIAYSHLDPDFFDQAKSAGTDARLGNWVGPMLDLMAGEQLTPDAIKLIAVRIDAVRASVRLLLNRLLNDAEFYQGDKPPAPIQVTWSGDTFINDKLALERIRLAQASGISSTTTAREKMNYDPAVESKRLKKEHGDKLSVTPAFEKSQGQGGKNPQGGRPNANELPAET